MNKQLNYISLSRIIIFKNFIFILNKYQNKNNYLLVNKIKINQIIE